MAMAVAGSVITFQLLAGISSSSSRAIGASAVGVESFVGLRGSSTTTSVAAASRLCFLGSDSARQLRASPNPVSVAGITEQFTSVSLRHLAWVVQKSKKKTGAGSSSSRVVVTAAATVAEEAAVPAVTTQAVQRPTKIGKGIVRLRLTRLGRKKRPFYRIVATHSSWRRDGKYIELLGHYNPLHAKDDMGIVVKADRIKYWLGVGAQPSDTVTGILHKVGILKKPELEQ